MSDNFWEAPTFWTTIIGVIVGSSLTIFKELIFERREQSRLRTFAAIRLVFIMDAFADSCSEVVSDDGFWAPSDDGQDVREPEVEKPTFPAFPDDIDWKALDQELVFRILSVPSEVAAADRSIDFTLDVIAFPPEYSEWFDARQKQYADLGLIAHQISKDLRAKYGLKRKEIGYRDIADQFWAKKKEIEMEEENRIKRQIEFMNRV